MKLDSIKELVPVIYCKMPVKISSFSFEEKHECFHDHWHDRMELVFVESGEMDISVNGQKSFCVKSGEMAVFSPRDRHYGCCKNKVRYFVIMFDPEKYINSTEAVKTLLLPLSESRISFEKIIPEKQLFELGIKIRDESKNDDTASALTIEGYIYRILGLLFKNHISEKTAVPEGGERFKKVYDYIAQSLPEKLSTGKLCGMFGYDESYFCRRFKAETGCTPSEYIRIMRLENSLEMLRNGTSVADTANICGFSSPLYFTRCFKAKYKMTPTQYIKKQAE